MGAQLIITRGDSAVSFLISARILLLSSALLCPSFVCVQSHRNHRHVLLLRRTHARVCLCNRCVCVCMFFRATGLVFFPTFVGTHQTQLFLFCFLNAKEFAACAAAACVIGNSWVKYFSTTTGRRLLLVVVVGNSTKLPVLIYWPAGHTYTHTHYLGTHHHIRLECFPSGRGARCECVSLSFFTISFWVLPPAGGSLQWLPKQMKNARVLLFFLFFLFRRFTHEVNNNLEQKDEKRTCS